MSGPSVTNSIAPAPGSPVTVGGVPTVNTTPATPTTTSANNTIGRAFDPVTTPMKGGRSRKYRAGRSRRSARRSRRSARRSRKTKKYIW